MLLLVGGLHQASPQLADTISGGDDVDVQLVVQQVVDILRFQLLVRPVRLQDEVQSGKLLSPIVLKQGVRQITVVIASFSSTGRLLTVETDQGRRNLNKIK